jgi:hypothetical protein
MQIYKIIFDADNNLVDLHLKMGELIIGNGE